AAESGTSLDQKLSAQAKLRSKHNTYMAVPVVFIMISNHFPVATYGNTYNWEILVALVIAGWIAAGLIRRS
ncbi:MAG TPA: urate hydroxylase PuuD, partial [Candidatus Acidoferrales bacterium]|nr:urate hydroxylase PuuD [Candidatus Acidoferrales bacterium]